ncbi:hypothetical protein BofuT4_P000160.1 [Botrytis cinerea T4]|uniref:AN1-type domain-containing protein n=1 Tax=Botryotinia fuckeliana (strain T4) TaxID=999810 RepID=G2YLS1_BOTF4|nr:hypothetical protein BofuT4_P000160.1 [Botrytis cinerea T4]
MASSSNSETPEDTSFSTMDEKDPTLIGVHCQYEYCNQLDFLPFRCESCRGTFCLDHRTESSHHCSKPGEWAARRRLANQSKRSLGEGKMMADVYIVLYVIGTIVSNIDWEKTTIVKTSYQ